jgi:peptidoglycan/xylan/chitin deacetylase (PgdA/CDA1 family)
MIGVNILQNQPQFKFAFETLQDDIAVHTWSHPYMTTLPNDQVVAEIGYTIQVRSIVGDQVLDVSLSTSADHSRPHWGSRPSFLASALRRL